MSENNKVIITILMWFSCVALSITGMIFGGINAFPWILLVPLLAALLGTVMIWVAAPTISRPERTTPYEKAKRQVGDSDSRMALLLELMDEDERQAFKETLKRRVLDEAYITDDGEIGYGGTTLGSLLDEQDEGKRLRR